MTRIRDLSIKSRLYGLVATAVLGFAAVLALTFWLSHEYQVNGPLYNQLTMWRSVISEYEPATLSVTQPALSLSLLLVTTNPDEERQRIATFHKKEGVYRDRRAHWNEN